MEQNPGAISSNELAIERTWMAYERTMMAWVRTATSMITFGFTIYKFFEFELRKQNLPASDHLIGPREFALILIGIGLFALVISSYQHVRTVRKLRRSHPNLPRSTAGLVSAVLSLLGLLALAGVIFRQ